MKAPMLLDRMSYWQRLLDRAIATQPTGAAKSNRLVLTTLHAVVTESFELYRDLSNGLALLLDSFFHLQYETCVSAFQACVRASKQFEELSAFYSLCKSIGVGRTSEYPSVQKISDELVETLQEFLKDQASFPNGEEKSPGFSISRSGSGHDSEQSPERGTGRRSDRRSRQASLEDLISATEAAALSNLAAENPEQQAGKLGQQEDLISAGFDPKTNPSVDDHFTTFDPWTEAIQKQGGGGGEIKQDPKPSEMDCWDLVLFDAASQAKPESPNQAIPPASLNNPFLADTKQNPVAAGDPDSFPATGAAPTFRAADSNGTASFKVENDPFEPASGRLLIEGPVNPQKLQQEQQLWIENQNKIIAKHLSR